MEEKTKKRGWVKDAAIIFLAVLLVLTFFSSTILNRSLPEVATEYVTDGTITSKVRGTGTVVAKENYDVTIEQSHKVVSVLVNVGQEVAAGDVLMILQAGESTELEMAMEQLANLEDQYQRKLINASSSDYAREDRNIAKAREELESLKEKLEEAVIPAEDTAEYEKAYAEAEALIEKLEAEIEAKQAEIDSVQAEIDTVSGSLKDVVWEKKAVEVQKQAVVDEKQAIVDEKQAIVDAANDALTKANEKLANLGATGNGTALSNATSRLHAAENNVDSAKRYLDEKLRENGTAYDRIKEEAQRLMDAAGTTDKTFTDFLKKAAEDLGLEEEYSIVSTAEQAYNVALVEMSNAQADYDKAYSEYKENNSNNFQIREAVQELSVAQNVYDAAKDELDDAQEELNDALTELKKAQDAVSEAQLALTKLQQGNDEFALEWETAKLVEKKADLTEAKAKLDKELAETKADADEMKADMDKREAEYKAAKTAVENQENALEDLIFNLEQQKKNDGVSAQLEALDRKKLLDQIEKQKAEIEELTSEDEGTEVVSLVSGTVQSISVSAGHEAKAGAVLATIEVPDLGYTLTFSVTNDQARRLKVGDTTTVSNFYWGSQIDATLTAIKTDPQNPQGSKQLTFDVTGDVTAGSSLTLSIGEKNANYDMVVPNSAIRSDVNGSFVLKITAKNSPLGNRYFASRVNVEVIASDEKYTAISGAIEAYDSVITTASRNAPIEAGDQVRLADSNA